ncbi:F-box protein GID2 [Tripterygium wilfordii]|uniref:F-box protein GID2 n=1 Tax=Tripterygium wilfordii TaxID=458696 RepID=A0A7J7D2T0_TRIWF|nr:F-box protein GID2 [Tripterygium wilfordii]
MKRTLTCGEFPVTRDEGTKKMKMIKQDDDGDDDEEEVNKETGFVHLDENSLFEVFKHVDARTLGPAVWSLPPLGMFKLNVDGACFNDKGSCGVGGVMRDDRGRVSFSFSCYRQGVLDPMKIESLAVLVGLQIVHFLARNFHRALGTMVWMEEIPAWAILGL